MNKNQRFLAFNETNFRQRIDSSSSLSVLARAKALLLLFFILAIVPYTSGQYAPDLIEQVIVETYYVSDKNDTVSSEDGDRLPLGAITYRIYIDLVDSASLLSVYGDSNHALKFSATAPFFNHSSRAVSFGKDVKATALDENCAALDSWITMGWASNKHFGVLKTDDRDSSIVGGKNNDMGILAAEEAKAGIPLTRADGLTIAPTKNSFSHQNIISLNGKDSSIFGSIVPSNRFISNKAGLISSTGIADTINVNKILVAQLTTNGDSLAFQLNIKVKYNGKTYQYVGDNDTLVEYEVAGSGSLKYFEKYSKWLSYPFECGCQSPYFLEYDKNAFCGDSARYCLTPIVLGCTDSSACNYDSTANKDNGLCCKTNKCFPNIKVVCPGQWYGCTDPTAKNYNPSATIDDSSCLYCLGCKNKEYYEYTPNDCYDDGYQCKVHAVKGCMDLSACNYNPVANIPDNTTCKYDCKQKSSKTDHEDPILKIYPSPATNVMNIEYFANSDQSIQCQITDICGLVKQSISWNAKSKNINLKTINIAGLKNGLYIVQLTIDGHKHAKMLVKN